MSKIERNVDSMKYRKSTHIASVDIEIMVAEKGKCVLTIKDAYFGRGVEVSGNKTDGYFIEFAEPVKPMVVNSGNRKIIANLAKKLKNLSSTESRNIDNWKGLKIELKADPTVKMMGQVVGGIKVVPTSPTPDISDANALEIIGSSKTLAELQANWGKISREEQSLASVVKLKDDLKDKLK